MEARGHKVREYESTGLRIEQFLFSFYLNAIIYMYLLLSIFHHEASLRRRTHRSSWGSRQGNTRRQQHHNLMEGCMTCRKSREQRALSARNASLPVEHCCIPLVEACFHSSWRGLPKNTDPLRSRLTRYMSCDSSHERQLRMSRSENWLRAASPANSNWGHLAQVLELVHLAQVVPKTIGSFFMSTAHHMNPRKQAFDAKSCLISIVSTES